MKAQDLFFQLSDSDEYIVRTYRCSEFRRLFREPVVGFLTITNKRVVFHSRGSSFTGKSLLLTEMPLDDVAGLSFYEGASINWLVFPVFCIISSFLIYILDIFSSGFLVNYFTALLTVIPFVLSMILRSNIMSDMAKNKVFDLFDRILGKSIDRDINRYIPYARMAAYVGLIFFSWRFAFPSEPDSSSSFIGLLLLLVVYVFVFVNMFGAYQRSFSLLIGSKSMKDKGIFIPGDTLRLLSTRDTTALQALGASPAEDATRVINELGALLMDIRQLGDLGMQKWRQQ